MCGGVGIPAAVGVWMVPVALLQLMEEMGGRFQAIALNKPHNNPLQYRSIVEPHSFITHKLMLVRKLKYSGTSFIHHTQADVGS